MATLTISHEMGAGGPEIGMAVAQRYGLLEEKLTHLDESKPTLFERFDTETRRIIMVIQTALFEFAEQDNVVLIRGRRTWVHIGNPGIERR